MDNSFILFLAFLGISGVYLIYINPDLLNGLFSYLDIGGVLFSTLSPIIIIVTIGFALFCIVRKIFS